MNALQLNFFFKSDPRFAGDHLLIERVVINKSIVEGTIRHEGKKGSKYTFGSKLVTQKSPGKV